MKNNKKNLKSLLLCLVLTFSLVLPSTLSYANTEDNISLKDDFYTNVNQKWLNEAVIPKEYSSWSNFTDLRVQSSQNIKAIIEELKQNKATLEKNSDQEKLVKFYETAINLEKRNEQGVKPLKKYLDKISYIKNYDDIEKNIASLALDGFDTILPVGIDSDLEDSSKNILYISSAQTGLNRSYYFDEDEKTKNIQNEYKKYLKKLFILNTNSDEEATKKAEMVFEFEKKLAENKYTKEESRDIDKLNNPYTIDNLNELSKTIVMKDYLKELSLENPNKILVMNPKYIQALDNILVDANFDSLKAYLEATLLTNAGSFLSKDFMVCEFDFKKVFSGVEKMKSDEKIASELIDSLFSEQLGKIYVEKHFSKEAKEDVQGMVEEIISTYKKRIDRLDWMSIDTKSKAKEKLDAITIKIGYPDEFESFTDLEIKSYDEGGSLLSNIINHSKYEIQKNFSLLNKKVDKTKWHMSPQTVNAYYNPSNNEIVFPAGILQAPFYSYEASKEANLGGIGAVIGHEISHGFDDQGSRFDKDGNMIDWWTKKDLEEYNKRTKKLAEQYSAYEAIEGEFVNGNLTLGENIADLGGVSVALEIAKQEKDANLDEFFKSYAKIWRNIKTDEIISYLLKNDPHSPGIFRVNGILRNIDEFYNVYDIKEEDKMFTNKENRIRIW
ncbi:MAG: M13 family metallopeptidase [Peptostreptococcaceae bacterium]|jgi:putative endopeptidase|nr:M13 family metallopeptidase [Peptostreptococcaceae bacterium]